ncbi:MAG: fructose transporter [Microbacteriaceae bacterium]|nr:fructose transporter [Microbacteriaceae bacterium]
MSTPDPAIVAAGASVALDDLARRAIALIPRQGRVILGIAGSPGAGKTTLAIGLARRVNEMLAEIEGADAAAVHLPMDGYHLANSTLTRLGIRDRKGAIDTFDGWGFLSLLRRLVVETDHTVYAPSFDRTVDEGIAGEIAVTPGVRLVVVEGNYLLADVEPWAQIAEVLAESWFCETSEAERLRRLVDRHTRHGRSARAAEEWATSVDGANALLIEGTRTRADLVVSGEGAGHSPAFASSPPAPSSEQSGPG